MDVTILYGIGDTKESVKKGDMKIRRGRPRMFYPRIPSEESN